MTRKALATVLCLYMSVAGVSLTVAAPPQEAKRPGFASPQEAWETYRYALHEGRWKEAFHCLTPEAQDRQFVGFVFTSSMLHRSPDQSLVQKLTAILKTHGLDVAKIESDTNDVPAKEDTAGYAKELAHNVRDREGLYLEVRALLDPVMPHPTNKTGRRVAANGSLTKMAIAGLSATGEYTMTLDPRYETFIRGGVTQTEMTVEAQFKKIGGRWFVDCD